METKENSEQLALASRGLQQACGLSKETADLMSKLLDGALEGVMDANIELAARFETHREKAIVSSYFVLSIMEWLEDGGRLEAAQGVVRIAQLETIINRGK